MLSIIKRILRFDLFGRKEQAEMLVEILVRLEKEGEVKIYEIFENGEWDYCIKKVDSK